VSTLVAGSVTIASDETVTGSEYALALYTADAATLTLPPLPGLGSTTAPYSADHPVDATDIATTQAARLVLLRDAARRATAYASATVTYLQAHGIGT
jgi:hypothetical protein